jgi:hypothetical protein
MEFVNPDYSNLGYGRLAQGNHGRSKRRQFRPERCTICDERKKSGYNKEGRVWFLMTQNQAEDKLNIWRWNQQMGGRARVHSLCSPRHVRELIVHWMTTGSLDYPFASGPRPVPGSRENATAAFVKGTATPVGCRLGELAVERDSLARVLQENPMSLNILLDELMVALDCEGSEETESELEDAMRIWLRTV